MRRLSRAQQHSAILPLTGSLKKMREELLTEDWNVYRPSGNEPSCRRPRRAYGVASPLLRPRIPILGSLGYSQRDFLEIQIVPGERCPRIRVDINLPRYWKLLMPNDGEIKAHSCNQLLPGSFQSHSSVCRRDAYIKTQVYICILKAVPTKGALFCIKSV